jgi:hypothetical protein
MRLGAFGRRAAGLLAVLVATALGASLAVTAGGGTSRASSGRRPDTGGRGAPHTAGRGAPHATGRGAPHAAAGGGVGFLAQSVSFVSDDHGFVLGAVRCAAGWCPAMRATLDRGASWSATTAPPAAIDSTRFGSIDRVSFANPEDGFAFGPGLWETQDAGATWREVVLPGPVAAFGVSSRTAYAVVAVDCSGLATCRAPSALFESVLGSGTWHSDPSVSIQGSDLEGADVSTAGNAVYIAAGDAFIGSTTGKAFHELTDPCPPSPPPPGYGITAITAEGPSDLTVLCGGGVAMGSQAKLVYVSDDGGASYRQLAVPPAAGDTLAIAASAPTTVFLSARSGASYVYRTSGADTSWTTAVSFGDGGIGITDLSFVSPADGALIHGTTVVQQAQTFLSSGRPTRIGGTVGVLYLTQDGGRTWEPTPIVTR